MAPKKSKRRSVPAGGQSYIEMEKKYSGPDRRRTSRIVPGQLFEDSTNIKGGRKKKTFREGLPDENTLESASGSFIKSGTKSDQTEQSERIRKKVTNVSWPETASGLMMCINNCADQQKSRQRDSKDGDNEPSSPPQATCVKNCRRKVKMDGSGPAEKGKDGKDESKTEHEDELSVCDSACGKDMQGVDSNLEHGKESNLEHGKESNLEHGKDSNLEHGKDSNLEHGKDSNLEHGKDSKPESSIYTYLKRGILNALEADEINRLATMFAGEQPDAGHCLPLCCPPNIRRESELLEEFVREMMEEVELANVDMEECLCEEVTRWMRYFMCGCGLGRGGRAELADAVVQADLNIPGLLEALVNELNAQAELAQEPPSDKKKKRSPDDQHLRDYITSRALKSVKHLEDARDRFKVDTALKVAQDIAAKQYEEIMRAQLNVMIDMLEKKTAKDKPPKLGFPLAKIKDSEFYIKSNIIPEL